MIPILTTGALKLAADDPAASLSLLKALLDSTPDSIAVMDTDFVYVACNAAFMRFLDKGEGEIIGKTDFDLFPDAEAGQCRQDYLHLLDTGEPVLRDMYITYAQGKRSFQVAKTPLRNREGAIEGIVLTIRDITERRQAEESVRLQAERYATLLTTSHDGFWIMGTDGRFREVNQAFCDMTGYSREELLRMHITDLEAMEKPEETALHIKKIVQQGYDRFDTRHRRKDGTVIDVEISTSFWCPNSEFLVFCRDITERRRADLQRQRYEVELQEAWKQAEYENQAKTRFLATASHDLRQPIQAMLLLSNLLVNSDLPPSSAEIAFRMQEAVDGLGEMLTALLDISKLDAGLVKPDMTEFRINDLILQLADEHLPLARERGIELRCVNSSVYVCSDQNLLSRILRNLISNAIKYAPFGKVLIGVRREATFARIQVLDTGIGIDEEEQERVFDEFYQRGNTARDRREGLGLGLAIVKRLARLLDHSLDVTSQPGVGTCFNIHVPIASISEDQHEWLPDHASDLPVPYEGAEILVVDDEIDIREGLEMNLLRWGYAVRTAADFDQAMAVLNESSPPVLVIADYRLGAKTGIDVIREVQRRCEGKVATLLLTGDATEESTREAERLGVQLLRKPLSGDQLRRAIIGCLGSAG